TTATSTSSCRSGRRPDEAFLIDLAAGARTGSPASDQSAVRRLGLEQFRGYATLDAAFGAGPQLVWGPNAAGKTSLLEAVVLLAWGHSHRSTADPELIRWGADVARVEASVGEHEARLEVALVRPGSASAAAGGRKRIRVNGVARRPSALLDHLRVVLFA